MTIQERQEKARQIDAYITLGENLDKDLRIAYTEMLASTGSKINTEKILFETADRIPENVRRVFMAPISAYLRMSHPSDESALMEHLEGIERELSLLEVEHSDFSKELHVLNRLSLTIIKLQETYKAGVEKGKKERAPKK